MRYPHTRLRRLRSRPALRALVRETEWNTADLIQPLFVRPGTRQRRPIASLPGQFQLSTDELVKEAAAVADAGIPGIILFGIPAAKDAQATAAHAANGIVPQTVRALKKELPDLLVICDVCLCAYLNHGHCGLVRAGRVQNDPTLKLLAKTALAYAEAGADIIAPSDMMDGRVAAIRSALDSRGFSDTPILSYAAKYASAFYAPFREAAASAPQFGDRKTYQMDPANSDEALNEIALDLAEGADVVMIKPALPYLDVIRRVKDKFTVPVAAYNVSGEYAMVKAAAKNGWLDERAAAWEILTAIKRAGADFILTYWAKEAAHWR